MHERKKERKTGERRRGGGEEESPLGISISSGMACAHTAATQRVGKSTGPLSLDADSSRSSAD